MAFSRLTRSSFVAGTASLAAAAATVGASALTPLEVAVLVDVNAAAPGTPIPADFLGLSVESERLAEPTFVNADNVSLVALFRRLGTGLVLRIGGESLQRVSFTNGAAPAGSNAIAIGPADIARLAAFLNATGWRAIYGIDLAHGTPDAAAAQAAAVNTGLGARLAAFEIGNEPDRYAATGARPASYGYPEYQAEFASFATAIGFRAPAARIAGPGVATTAMPFLDRFARDRQGALLTAHYAGAQADDPALAIPALLRPNPARAALLAQLRADAGANGAFRLTELDPVSRPGKAGVSDVFAAALWTLDVLFQIAAAGGAGVNVDLPRTGFLAPIVADDAGTHLVRPSYYGLLAFSLASHGTLISAVTDRREVDLASYTVRAEDGTTIVTLINKDLAQEALVTIDLHRSLARVNIVRLNAGAVDALRGVTLGGTAVGLDGSYVPHPPEQTSPNGGTTAAVRVAPASAAIVSLG